MSHACKQVIRQFINPVPERTQKCPSAVSWLLSLHAMNLA